MSSASVAMSMDPKQPPEPLAVHRTVDVDGVALASLTERETVAHVVDALDQGVGGWMVTVNLDILRRLRRDESFRALTDEATLFVADGMPLIWASRLQGAALPERVAGSNLVSSLTIEAGRRGRSVFLLGGAPGSAEKAQEVMQALDSSVRVAGVHCPPMGFESDRAEMAAIREALTDASPDIVYVALGCPKQERLIRAVRDTAPGAWWIGVGVSFSFLAGDVQRAPGWMQAAGLEWIHRLAQEPGRLGRRYLVDGLPFAAGLLLRAGWRRCTGRGRRAVTEGAGES